MNISYDLLFNPAVIYDTLFWGIQTVSEYPNLEDFKLKDEKKYNQWCEFVHQKFGANELTNDNYLKYSKLYAEFSKVLSFCYATIENKNNEISRKLKIISEDTEKENIVKILDVLNYFDSMGNSASPKFEFTMCGLNLINYDIPILSKKIINLNGFDNNKTLPSIIKSYLTSKPWNSNIIDVKSSYNMNANMPYVDFDTMCDFMGLKQGDNVIKQDISKYYWENIDNDPETTMKNINYNLANIINVNIQFVNRFRHI
ncbi:MAG: hypothetical protein ACOC2W_04235 [bacterium]